MTVNPSLALPIAVVAAVNSSATAITAAPASARTRCGTLLRRGGALTGGDGGGCTGSPPGAGGADGAGAGGLVMGTVTCAYPFFLSVMTVHAPSCIRSPSRTGTGTFGSIGSDEPFSVVPLAEPGSTSIHVPSGCASSTACR